MSVKFSFRAGQKAGLRPKKPKAVATGAYVETFSPASPGSDLKTEQGIRELRQLGFAVENVQPLRPEGYFAADTDSRRREFLGLLARPDIAALFAVRGGYGSNYLLDGIEKHDFGTPKCVVGYSDLTTLQVYLWQRHGWVALHGPMVAAGLHAGDGAPNGYDRASLLEALTNAAGGWNVELRGVAMAAGRTEGRVLGGAMTIVEATLGTPWELQTEDSILLLEDRGMKPYQVDRVLMHLKQAGKLAGVRGIILGEFPECDPPVSGSPTVREVCERILGPLRIPIVFGAAIGHTQRPMLTIPLGVRARLNAEGEGTIEFLESAVTS